MPSQDNARDAALVDRFSGVDRDILRRIASDLLAQVESGDCIGIGLIIEGRTDLSVTYYGGRHVLIGGAFRLAHQIANELDEEAR